MLVEVTYRASEYDEREWVDGFLNTSAVNQIIPFGGWGIVRMSNGDEYTIDEESRKRLIRSFEEESGVAWI